MSSRSAREKNAAIDAILDGHEDDISNWIKHNDPSLRLWLRDVMGLDNMSVEDLRDNYGAYLPDEEELDV